MAGTPTFDLLIVGGGINGAGIARDAAGRGLKVLLVEKDDLAAHTSSASSKLIHGGLRYLEQFQFRLVRESLAERERLLRIAPHLIRPLDFVIPQEGSPRPAWLVRLALLLYDNLAGRNRLPNTRTITLATDDRGIGLRRQEGKAFVYADCFADDSRLVVLNALDAAERGARILTRTELIAAERGKTAWTATVRGPAGEEQVEARVLVNAAGPWVSDLLQRVNVMSRRRIRLVKGSHVVVPRLYDGDHAFLIQNSDRRIVFAIPFETDFTLIGTTDSFWNGELGNPEIDEAETDYLLDAVRRTFAKRIERRDIAWTYSGIRPLFDDGSSTAAKVTRDYMLELDEHGAPVLSIFGGKLTTYRRLAEHALHRMGHIFPGASGPWTAETALPGGDGDPAALLSSLESEFPRLPGALLRRMSRAYGARTKRILAGADTLDDLGPVLAGDLTAREVDYLVNVEWARTAGDILFRRTKLGLHIDRSATGPLEDYLERIRHAA